MDRKVFLVADTDADLVKRVHDTLKIAYEGAIVYTANDGNDALMKINNVPPALLITELDLPRFSGTELIRTSLAINTFSQMAVIVLTDIPDQETFVDEVAKGRIQFLTKPFSSQQFLDAVNRALHRSGGQKEAEFRLRLLNPGDLLFAEGDQATAAFLLKKGKLRAFRLQSDGQSKTLGEVLAGEFVGEMAHINGEPRSAHVEALESSELIEIPLGTLDTLLFSKPAWSKALMKTLSRRLKTANMPK